MNTLIPAVKKNGVRYSSCAKPKHLNLKLEYVIYSLDCLTFTLMIAGDGTNGIDSLFCGNLAVIGDE